VGERANEREGEGGGEKRPMDKERPTGSLSLFVFSLARGLTLSMFTYVHESEKV
jgi:hypothetical protein